MIPPISRNRFSTASDRTEGGGDFNSDGVPDVVVAAGSAQLSFYLGNGDGTLQAAVSVARPGAANGVAVADFDHDGDLYVAAIIPGSNTLTILIGDGRGGFSASPTLDTGALPVAIAAQDLNGDGNVDLVVSDQDVRAVSVYLGNGDSTFKPGIKYRTADRPATLVIEDMNRDGIPDIVVTTLSDIYAVPVDSRPFEPQLLLRQSSDGG